MFTTGTKLLLGATLLAVVAAVLYGTTQDGGALGTVGLVSAATALAFLSAIVIFVRDCTVSAADTDAAAEAAAAQPAPGHSMWPVVAGASAGLLAVGVVTHRIVFVLGVVALLATIVEWMVQAWSERASSDPSYNARVRSRLLHPLEFPVLGAVGVGVIIYSFSRIMLALSKEGGPVAFGVVAALVLVAGALFALRPSLKRTIVAAVCAIGGIGIVAGGVAGGVSGERELHAHETTADLAAEGHCESNEHTHADENASESLAAKSNPFATVILKDGELWAESVGLSGKQERLTMPLGTPANIIFKNEDDHPARLVANLGQVPALDADGNPVADRTVADISCTALAEDGAVQFITLRPMRSSRGVDEPYTLSVPDVDDVIEVVVP